jgi:hypothetical protein
MKVEALGSVPSATARFRRAIMSDTPQVLLSGFCDEASRSKRIDEQFSVFAALGLRYVSLRFVDVGTGIKNMVQLNDAELAIVVSKLDEYGLSVSSLGSPIGKVKLQDIDDGTQNIYRPFDEYLAHEVMRAAQVATRIGTRLVRGFSFYHPRGTDAEAAIDSVVPRLRSIAELFDQAGLSFGLEVEANLVGHTGGLMARLFHEVNHPAMFLIFDGGNLVTQGFSREEIFEQWQQMKPGLGWLHVKDHRAIRHSGDQGHWVDEAALTDFVTVDEGASGYEAIFSALASDMHSITARLVGRQIPGVFVDLEPHVRGGGQFGGYSGPDGMGIAHRSLCRMLRRCGLSYDERTQADLRA